MKKTRNLVSKYPKVIFLHIGWARKYQGAVDDPPLGKFGYFVEGGKTAGEAFNFKSFKRYCYGYAPFNKVNISRLGAEPSADYVDNILVIWTATDPGEGGRYIVGWYKNARVYAKMDNRRPCQVRPEAITVAALEDCHLIPESDRSFYVPSMVKGWAGMANGFYASDTLSQKELDKVFAYVNGQTSTGFYQGKAENRENSTRGKEGSRNQDPEERVLIEKAAIDLVTAYYQSKKWKVTSVEKDNRGWDLEARRSGRFLGIEVKGLSGEGGIELTPGEYKAMVADKTRMSYRLAVVRKARSENPKLTIFEYIPASKKWVSEEGHILKIKESIGAKIEF